MYIRDTIPYTERNDLLSNTLETICIEVSRPCSKPFLVSTWYRPPNSDAQIFHDFEVFLWNCDLEDKEQILLVSIISEKKL